MLFRRTPRLQLPYTVAVFRDACARFTAEPVSVTRGRDGGTYEVSVASWFGDDPQRVTVRLGIWASGEADQIMFDLTTDVLPALVAGPLVPVGSGTGEHWPGQVAHLAQRFVALRDDFDDLTVLLDDHVQVELRELIAPFVRRWLDWFAAVGPDEIVLLNRLAGEQAAAEADGFGSWAVPGTSQIPDWLITQTFSHFADIWMSGETDFRGTVIPRSLAECRTTPAKQLIGPLGNLIDHFAEGVLPDVGHSEEMLVVAYTQAWSRMFWSEALELSFPSARSAGHVAVVLPEQVAQTVARTLRSGLGLAAIPAVEVESLEVLVMTHGALVGDGLDPDAALETALAVLA